MPFGACGIPLRNSVMRFEDSDLRWQTHCQALAAAVAEEEEAVPAVVAEAEEADRGQEFGLSRTARHSNCVKPGSICTRPRCLAIQARYLTPT